jgi:hypothetical protein
LQEIEVDMDVDPLGLETSEAVGDGFECLADRIEMVLALFETEVGDVVGAEFVARDSGELVILPEDGVPEMGAEDTMPCSIEEIPDPRSAWGGLLATFRRKNSRFVVSKRIR